MIRLKARMNATATKRAVRAIAKAVQKDMSSAMFAHAKFAARFVKKERFTPYPGPFSENKSRTILYRRTGKLQGSIRATRIGADGGATVEAGRGIADLRAPLNEFGGTVVGTPFVEVPLPGNLTPKTGQPKAGAGTVGEALANGAFIVTSSRGNKIVVREGARGKRTPLFILKSAVFIPARFGFGATVMRDTRVVRDRNIRLKDAANKLITKHFGR